MQNTTSDYKLEITKDNIEVEAKITIGNNIYTSSDITNLVLEYTQPQEGFAIGNTLSQSLDLTLLNRKDIIYNTSQIKLEIGLKIGSTIEYIPMGIFNIDDVEKTDYTTKFTCYDNMIKFEKAFSTSLGDILTLQQVISELTRITGVEFTGSLPSYTVKKLEGFSCREILGYVASICGGNAIITRDGKFTIKGLTEVEKSIDGHNIILNNYKTEEVKYKVGQVSCQADENNILSKGSLGTDSMELQFENPWVNETILNDIYNKVKSVEYLGYSMKWTGDLALDIYDVVSVTDAKNITRKLPILSQKITCTKGIVSEIGAKGETKNKNSFSSSGSTTNKVNRAVMELAVINQALIDKANIRDLEAVSIRTETLEAKTAKIEEAIIDVAHIKDLNAINASIENLIAEDARITNLISTKANITDLTATNIKFNVGTGGTLDLQTLLSKFVTGENGQFLNLTTDNVTISNAVIKDIIAKNISVEDLKAGKISTNKFTVASDDGGITIVGPTMQFKDKSNKVRIQMGQDTQGNFNFILRGEDGTTTLIDHTGIKEKAIADDLIKSNMVAENAIGEKQINYSSLITGLNKNDNTSLILASKIAIDLTGQSLDVAFNSLKTTVDNTEIGGRNYIRDYKFKSEDIWKKSRSEAKIDITNGYGYLTGTTGNPFLYQDLEPGLIKKGDVLTLQYEVKFEGVAPNTGTNSFLVRTQLTGYSDSNSMVQDIGIFGKHESDGLYLEEGWQKVVKTITITSNAVFEFARFRLYARNLKGTIYFRNVKLERGNKATDLSEAPEDAEEKIESNTTALSIAQGKIDGLISESSITKGDVTTLKDNYTSIKATVDKINTTVASHTSSIGNINTNVSGLSEKVTTVENKYTSLEQSLNGFKTTVSSTYSTKTELSNVDGKVTSLTNKVSTAESSITELDNKIDLNVSSIKKIVQEGNNNLVSNSNWLKGYSGWKLSAEYKGNYTYGVSSSIKLEDKRIIRLGNSGTNTITTIYADSPKFPVSPGEKITYGAFGAVTSNVTMQIYLLFTDNIKDITEDNSYMSGYTSINFAGNASYTKKNNTVTVPDGATRAFIRVRVTKIDTSINTGSSGVFSSLMVRKGEEVFEWCPSQGDSYTYIDEQTANLQVNINSITQRVSSTESNISTINGNVSSLQSRMSSAETKITSSAIINTVQATINNAKNEAINSANANTANKLQSYATKTEVTTTAENVIYKFSASGGYNLLKNSAFANKQIDNWWVWGGVSRWATESYYKEVGDMYIANPNTNNPGGLWQSEIPIKPNTKYTLSVTCYKEANVKGGWFGLEYQSSINSDSITYQNIELTFDDQRHSYTFTTPNNSNIKYAKVGFRHEGSITTGGGHLIKINKPCLVEGEVSVWSPNPFEVKDGSTIIDANGVKIYNGALTVLNNAGQIVLQGDSNGDLTFKGKLQPNDYQLRLFGNDCKIDGSANAIRMQLTSQKYCAMDSEGGFRIFNQYSNNGTRYTSVMMTSEGHVSIYNDRTRIKLLSEQNERPVIQCRNSGDNAYGDFHGADFLNRSTIKDKTNVETIEELDFTKILLENNIFKYNLKTDVENILEKFGLDAEYNLDEVIGSSADGRLGFILEELTEEAKAVLSPGNMESISIYSMCSILWKMCQQYHKRIEVLEAKVN